MTVSGAAFRPQGLESHNHDDRVLTLGQIGTLPNPTMSRDLSITAASERTPLPTAMTMHGQLRRALLTSA